MKLNIYNIPKSNSRTDLIPLMEFFHLLHKIDIRQHQRENNVNEDVTQSNDKAKQLVIETKNNKDTAK